MASAGVAVGVTLSPFPDHHVLIRITSAVDDDVRACSLYIDTEDGFWRRPPWLVWMTETVREVVTCGRVMEEAVLPVSHK